MCRVVPAWLLTGADVNTIALQGWMPVQEKLEAAIEYSASLELKKGDTVILDLWSTSSFLGTDEMGLTSPAKKKSGRW